jgi:hypothetical protein
VADALRTESDVEVDVVEGNRGELTVLLDGRVVAKKLLFIFKPSVENVLKAVRTGPSF